MAKLFLLAIIIGIGALAASSQSKADKPTPDETRSVNEVGRLFSKRFRQAKDVEPLLNDFFVSDFLGRSLKDESREWMMFVSLKLARKLPKRDLRRFFVAMTNVHYLSSLYAFSKYSSVDPSQHPDRDYLPTEVAAIFERDKYLLPTFNLEGNYSAGKEEEIFVESTAGFRSLTKSFTSVVPALKRAVNETRAGSTSQWYATMKDFGTRFHYYKPWVSKCIGTDTCYGYPQGTRIFLVNVELYQLSIVKINNRMKIISAFYYID